MLNKSLLFLAGTTVCAVTFAATPSELMDKAMKAGTSSGELTGAMAEAIKQATHSTDPTVAILERLEDVGGCQYFKFTLSQANVPFVNGGSAGEYRTVTKVGTCRGDAKPNPPIVLECKVGKTSCMPVKR
jgi:hypothetical protein